MPHLSPGRIAAAAILPLLLLAAGSAPTAAAAPSVLRVGSFNGIAGPYSSIQAAVNAAQPGDWVLVGPGDYHEKGSSDPTRSAGVLIQTAGVHLRGMNRNTTIIDGTNPAAPTACDPAPAVQDLGPADPAKSNQPAGRNGVEIYKTDGVSVENLTVCNYLAAATGGNGNEVWWNGGDRSGAIGLHSLSGAYLTASSSYNWSTDSRFAGKDSGSVPMAQYGIFTSNEGGPGQIDHTYASNMGDSAYYIGACRGQRPMGVDDCNLVLDDAHAEHSALGFSGTNAGGRLQISNGEWNDNLAGIAPNALNNDDWPSPPDGTCPPGATSPTANGNCAVIIHNNVHDNNNPNVPRYGIAGAAPPGTGILLSGVRDYTVIDNAIANNKAWGVVVNDFPDTETPPATVTAANQQCAGGTDLSTPLQPLCYYQAFGNEIEHNTFSANGGFGNPSNGDIAFASTPPTGGGAPNCAHDNTDTGGSVSFDPAANAAVDATCGPPNTNANAGPDLVELVCASPGALSFSPLPTINCSTLPAASYPAATAVTIKPIPHDLATMPDPCAGVPANPWCPGTAASTAVTAQTVVSGVPNTAAAGIGAGAGLLALSGLGMLVLAGRGRRRRQD